MFNPQQLAGLNAAYERKLKGTANPADLNNLAYAEKNGFKYQPAQPINPTNPTQPDNNAILANKLGQAGISLTDLVNLLSKESQPTINEKNKIYSDLGITDLEKKAFSLPSLDTEQLFNKKYSELGLNNLKDQITGLTKNYEAKKIDLNNKLGAVGENPWLPEASRIGRAKRLQELAQGDIGNLESQIANLQNLYGSGIDEINNYITRSSNDFTAEQNTNKAKLEYLLKKAESQMSDSTNQKVYRYVGDYLTGLSKNKAVKLENETDKTMIGKGYQYVNTPALRDQLKAQGYEIQTINGRTYAKAPKTTTKTVKSGKTTYLITYADGKEVKREAVGGGTSLIKNNQTSINNKDESITPETTYKPGSKQYKIAQDLAYGKLTFSQFRTLYAYSRDINEKSNIYNLAGQLNPNFDPANFELGYKVAANPKIRQQISALDNVMDRLPDLIDISDKASRSNITSLNKIIEKGGLALGNTKYSDFHTAQVAFADELSGALGFGSATDMSREMGFSMTDPTLSPKQFSSAMQNIVLPFIKAKRSTLLNQMGQYKGNVEKMSNPNENLNANNYRSKYNY